MAMGACCATWVWRPIHSRRVQLISLVYCTAAFLRRQLIPVCRQSNLPHLKQVPRGGSFLHQGVPQLGSNKQTSRASLNFEAAASSPLNMFVVLMPGHRRTCRCYGADSRPQQAPTPACSGQSCRGSGIMTKISIWETIRSRLAATCVCGGVVTSVPVGIRMTEWPLSITGSIWILNALIAPTTVCANTTR